MEIAGLAGLPVLAGIAISAELPVLAVMPEIPGFIEKSSSLDNTPCPAL